LYAELERKVDERTAELVRANEEILALNRAAQEAVVVQIDDQRTLIERQQETIQVLSVPIIEIWDSVIAVPLMGAIDDRRSQDVMHRLLARISSDACRFVILDLTGVEVV